MGRTRRWAAIVAVVAGLAIVGVLFLDSRTTAPVEGSPLPLVARTALRGEVAPFPTEGADLESLPRSPMGQECVDDPGRPAGAMSLCWEAYRDPRETDPVKDFYRLRVYGTFGGDAGTGVRWMSVRARIVDGVADGAFEAFPDGVFEGPCQQLPVPFGDHAFELGTICGRTVGSTNTDDWSHSVTWTCTDCLVADHMDRAIVLDERVGVPAGTVPTWEIYADLGS